MMKLILSAVVVAGALVACGGDVEPQREPESTVVAQQPAAAVEQDAGTTSEEDPYAYACCHFANEGLSEYDACCAKWRAEHDGKDSL